MRYDRSDPDCTKHECFACQEGKCILLTDNKFGKRECPFYKTKEQAEKEKEYYEQLKEDY